jgi:hypothetical protein
MRHPGRRHKGIDPGNQAHLQIGAAPGDLRQRRAHSQLCVLTPPSLSSECDPAPGGVELDIESGTRA